MPTEEPETYFENLEVDEDAHMPSEGVEFAPGQLEAEYLGAPEAPAAPVQAPAPVAEEPVVAEPAGEPAVAKPDVLELLKYYREKEAREARESAARQEAAAQAERDRQEAAAQAERARLKALRDSKEWRESTLKRFGLEPNQSNQVLLEQALRADDLEDELSQMRAEMREMRESMSQGRNLARAQGALEKLSSELSLPANVSAMVERQVADLVRAGWEPSEALEYAASPLREFAKASKPAPAAPAPKAPAPKKLSPEDKRALSAVSLQGRGAGKAFDNNPDRILADARRGLAVPLRRRN